MLCFLSASCAAGIGAACGYAAGRPTRQRRTQTNPEEAPLPPQKQETRSVKTSAAEGKVQVAAALPQLPRASILHQVLCQRLHGTSAGPYFDSNLTLVEDHSYPHTNVPEDFLAALFAQLQPSFLVEVGSFKGGSARRIVAALRRMQVEAAPSTPIDAAHVGPCLVCIDTFLGDASMWLNRQASGRDGLLLSRGFPQLYEQFIVNTRDCADLIVPFPVASLSGLRALQYLATESATPLADFIYLDAAHLKGETLLEIQEAMRVLRPGGVLIGDDLDWPAVESDLRDFVQSNSCAEQDKDDKGFATLAGAFFLAEGGYWIVEACPRQWMLRKTPVASSERAGQQLAELREHILAAESGATPSEYVPATAADKEALTLYLQASKLLEAGDVAEGSRMMKKAAELSASVAYHFQL